MEAIIKKNALNRDIQKEYLKPILELTKISKAMSSRERHVQSTANHCVLLSFKLSFNWIVDIKFIGYTSLLFCNCLLEFFLGDQPLCVELFQVCYACILGFFLYLGFYFTVPRIPLDYNCFVHQFSKGIKEHSRSICHKR